MPFEHRDHQADVVLVAWGSTLVEAFESGAQGLLELMVSTASIEPSVSVEITGQAEDLATLFVTFLNEVLFQRDQHGLFFRGVTVHRVEQGETGYTLSGTAWGEPVDLGKHRGRLEAKAATYGQLDYTCVDGTHRFQCIIDI